MGHSAYDATFRERPAWNAGRKLGARRGLKPRQVWAIRFWLDREQQLRDRALFDLAIDSKLRGCDVVMVRIGELLGGGRVRMRATVVQQKTGRPVHFELLELARVRISAWLECRGGTADAYGHPPSSEARPPPPPVYQGQFDPKALLAALREQGAGVIIGGRSSDCAVFAAPAIHHGLPEELAYYLGKVLECASFCAEPYGAKETVLGEITAKDVRVAAMSPSQRCTIASVVGHAMYERSNPFYEYVAGGLVDMSECNYEQAGDKTVRVTGSRFHRAEQFRVKLEGSGKVGERYVGLVGVRDPYSVANIDQMIGWAKAQVRERFGDTGYELHYTVYGRDGVMAAMEPNRTRPAHELAVLVQGIAQTKHMAEEVCLIGTRQMFYARRPEVKGTARSVAFPLDEVMPASPAYRWTVNHTMAVPNGLDLFPTHIETVGA